MRIAKLIKSIPKIYRTVTHLKFVQIVYQLKYRFARDNKLVHYAIPARTGANYTPIKFKLSLPPVHYATGQGGFAFLNLEAVFEKNIDWDFQDYGKLWNYNLQYFNYLQQDDIDDKIKQLWLADIGEWLNDGRLKLEPYPVALRAMNTIRYLSSVKDADSRIINDLQAQMNYLSSSFEYHLLGNHLLEDAFALLMGAYAFNTDAWKIKAQAVLYAQLKEQVLDDGAHFELSPMYHQIILFRVLELVDWYSNADSPDIEFLTFIQEKAVAMLNWLKRISFESGYIPHFNDSADEVAYTTKQLLGFAGELELNYQKHTRPLADSGYRKFKFGSYECAVDVADIGPSYQAGHSHADSLSFVLHYKNMPVLVEAGTSTYNEGEIRNYERSTAAHNTVVVNGQNSSHVWGGFRVAERARVRIIKDTEDYIMASHKGYKKKYNAVHQRSFTFDNFKMIICDELLGNDIIEAVSYLHLHPSIQFKAGNEQVILKEIGTLTFQGATKIEVAKYPFSIGFNNVTPSTAILISFKKTLQIHIDFLHHNQ